MRVRLLCVVFLCAALAIPAAAGVIYQSATLGPIGQSGGLGLTSDQFLGARFEITAPTTVTGIGGHLEGFFGSIFGSIIALDSMDALPQGSPFAGGEVLASTVFTPDSPSSDYRTPLSVTLAPGTYALVFGSGLFGATGMGVMAENNTDLSGASYFWWDGSRSSWYDGGFSNARFVVEGDSAVPEPTTVALAGLAFGALALLRRRGLRVS
jgi:hypothetical protein